MLLALLWATPTAAEVPVDAPEFAGIREFLGELGFPDQAIADVAAATDPDRLSDWYHPSGQPSGIRNSSTDIVAGSFFEIRTSPEMAEAWRAPGGPLDCDADGVYCPRTPGNEMPATEWSVYATVTATPPSPSTQLRMEFGLAAFDATPLGDANDVGWTPIPQFPGDFFGGFNVAWVTRSDLGADWQFFRLDYIGQGFSSPSARRVAPSRRRSPIVRPPVWSRRGGR